MSDLFNPERRQTRDRRRTARASASGRVEISFDYPAPVRIDAELIETSSMGFRALHDSKALEPGLEVSYRALSAAGRARVIWTHVLPGRRVSGFLIVSGTKWRQ